MCFRGWELTVCCLHSSSTLLTAGSDADEHLSAERVLITKCDEWPPEDGHKNSKSKNQKNQKHYQKKLNSSGCDGKKTEQLQKKVRKTRCLGCFGWLFRLCLFVGFVGSDAASASCFLVAIKPGLNGPLDNETNAMSRPMCAVDPGDTPLDSSAGFPAAPILELLQYADVAHLQINCSFFDDFAVDWGFDGGIFWGLWGVTVCVLTTVTCWLGGCYRRPKRRKLGSEKQKKKKLRTPSVRGHTKTKFKDFACFQCRKAGTSRKKRPKTKYRRRTQSIINHRMKYWASGRGFPLKRRFGLASPLWGLPNKPAKLLGSCGCHPSLSFRGGAAGSAASKRRKQDKNLLEGLKQLLIAADASDGESESEPISPSTSYRGRQVMFEPQTRDPDRDESPGWKTVSSRKEKGKGKGHGFRPSSKTPSDSQTRH